MACGIFFEKKLEVKIKEGDKPMERECCSSPSEKIMILPCSGGSNVGQLANQVAIELTREGFGKMYCLAGIGGHLESFVNAAKNSSSILTIDGCAKGCAKAVLRHVEIVPNRHLVVTDLGIVKSKDFILDRKAVEKIKEAVRMGCSDID